LGLQLFNTAPHPLFLRQKRRDIEETLAELGRVEENCVERLAELGVST
jgi:hypothetical protein